MKKQPVTLPVFALSALLALGSTAHAQAIERIKMTDNDLSCQQIYGEIGQMDGIIARVPSQPAMPVVAGAPAAVDNSGAVVGAQVAGVVAQTALINSAARGGLGGFGGFGGGGGLGGLGGLFGGIAQQAAQTNANQQAAQQAAAQQAAAQQAQQGAVMTQQAQGRKEHLTSLFLGKGCKMSEIQK